MNNSQANLPEVYGAGTCQQLVRLGRITSQDADRAHESAQKNGLQIEEALLRSNIATRTDLLEAAYEMGAILVASMLGDLPEWTVVLNDSGQSLAQVGERDHELAILFNEKDPHKRVFCLAVGEMPEQKKLHTRSKIRRAGYKLAGQINVTRELMDLVFNRWDKIKSGNGEFESESKLHEKFDAIGRLAVELKASDIHISNTIDGADVSMRIHGDLQKIEELSSEFATSLISSVYNTLVTGDSTKEGFNPLRNQDGAIERVFDGKMVRFRYSGLPLSPRGFDVTLRVIPIDVDERTVDLAELGYSPDQQEQFGRMFGRSSGLILIAGTTGSGKSTTLANQLEFLAESRPGKKIRTVEEPVEYRMRGVYQTPVKRVPGMEDPFLETLRQLLRSDPDVLGVGEIRDAITAELAIHAVRSGHLVASTLHADGAPICFERLIGMGVGRQSLAQINLVAGFVYQKLLQVLCPECAIEATDVVAKPMAPDVASMMRRVEAIQGGNLEGIFLRNPRGCAHCNGRGVTGRTVCAEIMRPTPEMVAAVGSADSIGLWRHWRKQIKPNEPGNMTGRTAFEHAIYKMRQGLVSPESIESEFHYLDEFQFPDDITLKADGGDASRQAEAA